MRLRRFLTTVLAAAVLPCAYAAPAAADFSAMYNCATYPSDQATTRAQVLQRAQSWLDVGVPYSQSACHQNQYGDYRTDCSGFLSMAWGLNHSRTTYTLDAVSHPIARADLKPGDAFNIPYSHTALFVGWADEARTRPTVIEQAGPNGAPTTRRTWSASYASTYTPIRYDKIVDSPTVHTDRVNQVNGDGYADLVAVDGNGELFGYNNGSLVFEGGVPFQGETWRIAHSDWRDATLLAAGDVNRDGYADLVATRTDGSLVVYGNGSLVNPNGQPYLAQTWSSAGGWHRMTQLAVADVTGDQYADLVAIDDTGALVVYANGSLVNAGGAPFKDATWRFPGWAGTRQLVLTDVNHDGYADLVGVAENGELFGYHNGTLVNEGRVPFRQETWRVTGSDWRATRYLTAGDLNSDGYGDLVSVDSDGGLSLYGNGILLPGSEGVPYRSRTWHIAGNWTNARAIA
ncbi:MAG: VCBS repeat-containing protein [Saccharothrix sp.]|nr:VCBS repeat-containing protein [Saccharothrix sp.]